MVWSILHTNVLQPLGQGLSSISAQEAAHAELWYLTPEQHVGELLFFNLLFLGGLFAAQRWHAKQTSTEAKGAEREDQQLSFILKVYRLILTSCLLVTICHKYLGNKLSNMFMPCHCATACYLYCLWTKDKKRAELTFNVSVHFLFYTFLAILMPDFRGLTLPGEIINFWVHHWILLIVPVHLIITRHYHLEPNKRWYYYVLAACWGGLVHFDVMGVAGLLSGLNVGYMLHPPKHTPFKGLWFRWGHAAFLIVMGGLCGFFLVPALHKLGDLLHSKKDAAKSSLNKHTRIVDGEHVVNGGKQVKKTQ